MKPKGFPCVALSVLLFGALVGVTSGLCIEATGGRFVYPLDDAYIHLVLAKNLANGDGYGIRPGEFIATSSSVLWPFFLAGSRLLTRSVLVPLVLNVGAALALVFLLDGYFRRAGASPRTSVVATWVTLAAMPVLPVVFIGMEHTAHVLAVLGLVFYVVGRSTTLETTGDASRPPASSFRDAATSCALSALAVGMRYESLFVLAALVPIVAWRQKWGLACGAVLGGMLPPLAQGLWAMKHGAPFFPISLLLKRTDVELAALPSVILRRLKDNPHVAALLLVLVLGHVALRRAPLFSRHRSVLLVAAVSMSFHLVFAQCGWFFRYEAYAVVLAVVAILGAFLGHREAFRRSAMPRGERLAAVAVVAMAAVPVVVRAAQGVRAVPAASANIDQQQMQTAAFVREYFSGKRVVINDLGVVAYFSDAELVDLMGLGSMEVFRARMRHPGKWLDRADIEALTRGADVAIVYDDWFAETLPSGWRRLGMWRIPNNKVCAKDTVSIYATRPGDEDALSRKLRAFAHRLPAAVEQSGPYTQAD